jgi:hypothetical protein
VIRLGATLMIRVERSEYRLDERVPDPKWGLLPTFYVPAVGIPGESDRHPFICPSDAIDDAITQRDGEARELPDHGEHYRGAENGSSGSDSRSILKMWKVKLKGTGHADEAASWYNLHERFEVKRINHQEAYSLDGACTNMAVEYFSATPLRDRDPPPHRGRVSPALCAGESSWRENNRRVSNGDQVNRIAALALKRGKSVDFTGYWQRHAQSA